MSKPTVSLVSPRAQVRGFTLIELMITVTVIGVLTAIAIPNYSAYTLRAGRAEGKAALLRAAQWLERGATATGTYTGADGTVALPTDLAKSATNNQRYNITYVRGGNGTTFALTATRTGAQTADTACGDLTLNQAGLRGRTGSAATVEECWNR